MGREEEEMGREEEMRREEQMGREEEEINKQYLFSSKNFLHHFNLMVFFLTYLSMI